MDKITVTLYDLLGYVLPGSILLFTLSMIEATFLGSHHLSLSAIAGNLALSVVVCYFLGTVAHSVGSILKDRFPKLFYDKKNRLDPIMIERAKSACKDFYGLTGESEKDLTSLEVYLLTDSYVVASGKVVEREVLQAREGFYKASMVALAVLSVFLLCAAGIGGATVQFSQQSSTGLGWVVTLFSGMAGVLVTLVFRRSFLFFNRIKVNNTILLFLALRGLDKDGTQKRS